MDSIAVPAPACAPDFGGVARGRALLWVSIGAVHAVS